jgi:hypothetical protein
MYNMSVAPIKVFVIGSFASKMMLRTRSNYRAFRSLFALMCP